jgi:hypothetical protein
MLTPKSEYGILLSGRLRGHRNWWRRLSIEIIRI